MAYDGLGAFIERLEKAGELVRVSAPVDVRLEITEIADRVMKQGGPALLFEHVTGPEGRYDMPVAINLLGSARRMAWALGVETLEEAQQKIRDLLGLAKGPPAGGFLQRLALLGRLAELGRIGPRTVRSGPVQERVYEGDAVDLGRLPIITCWPQDAGPYITLPLVITRDPVTGQRNVGMYRLQVLDRRSVALHWQRHKTGARHFERARAAGRRLPVAVAIGGDPALIYAASAPLPEGIDEMVFAGFFRGRGVELVPCRTVELEVPADAEIVLEGYADPEEPLVLEGPFGDHTGFYSLPDRYPRMHVTAITMRERPVYPTTIVGPPPMEDYWMGHATERIFLPLAQMVLPEIVDYHMPPEGVFHNLVMVAIEKQYPGHAFKVAQGLLGLGLMSLAKVIVVVDADVDVQNPVEAWWVALNHIDPERDVMFARGPIDVLDHASRGPAYGSKMIIDGTRKWPEEGFTRPWPDRIRMSDDIVERVTRRWEEYGLGRILSPHVGKVGRRRP